MRAPAIDRRALLTCVHCGLCLSSCPTFRVAGNEADSPRGRIYLMRAVAEGRIAPTRDVAVHIDSCVGCRACETVCPAGVPYGALLETTRAQLRVERPLSLPARAIHSFLFRVVLPHPIVLTLLAWATRAYQHSGAQRVVRTLGLTRWLPRRLRLLEELLPAPATPLRAPSRTGTGPRVVFLRTCMMDVALPNVDRATRIVLQRNAGSVAETRAHGCCGALHLHAGRRDEARTLARRTIRAAETARGDVYVTNSAGCGAAMKEYAHLLADDDAWRERAAAFSARVVDVTEYLADHGLELPADAERRESARVVYQDACHLAHGQRVRSAPRVLLRSTPSVDLVDLPHSDWCCGSGGIYNVLQPDWSDAVLADKIATIRRTGAEVVAVANPGCLLHIGRGLRSAGLRTRTAHPVELLAEAYARAEAPRRMHEPRNHWPGGPVVPVSVDESPARRDAADS